MRASGKGSISDRQGGKWVVGQTRQGSCLDKGAKVSYCEPRGPLSRNLRLYSCQNPTAKGPGGQVRR